MLRRVLPCCALAPLPLLRARASGLALTRVTQVANPSIAAGRVRAACLDTLRRLRVSRLDLYLVHSPFAGVDQLPMVDTWRAMEALVDEGLVREIGVSNFGEEDLRALLSHARIKPSVNQLEFHPYLQSRPLAALCAAEGVALAAYCPLGPLSLWPGGPVDAPVEAAAKAHGTTPAAVLLAWPLALGHAVVRCDLIVLIPGLVTHACVRR